MAEKFDVEARAKEIRNERQRAKEVRANAVSERVARVASLLARLDEQARFREVLARHPRIQFRERPGHGFSIEHDQMYFAFEEDKDGALSLVITLPKEGYKRSTISMPDDDKIIREAVEHLSQMIAEMD